MTATKLKIASILQVPFHTYQKDFTFIVNGEEFRTNKIIADIISHRISNMHQTDPTLDTFRFNTKSRGDFSNILKLADFNQINLPDAEISFLEEIINILDINSIDVSIPNIKITPKNVFKLIQKHEKNMNSYYSKSLIKEIDFLSKNFYDISEKNFSDFLKLSDETIERIISNENLSLDNEDQLLTFLNKICEENDRYSYLYEYVYFENVSKETIEHFINIFDVNYMTKSVWLSLTKRFLRNEIDLNLRRYNIIPGSINFLNESNDNKGILNYLKNKSEIDNEVSITSSSYGGGDMKNLLNFENPLKGFYTNNQQNAWICFEFKKHKIIPNGYVIKSQHNPKNYTHPRGWVIEASLNKKDWKIINQQNDCYFLNGSHLTHYFQIENNENQEFKFIRIRQIVPGWDHSNYFHIAAIEFFGTLVL